MLTKKQKNQTNKAVFLLRADPTWPHSPSLPFLKLKRTLSLSLSLSLSFSSHFDLHDHGPTKSTRDHHQRDIKNKSVDWNFSLEVTNMLRSSTELVLVDANPTSINALPAETIVYFFFFFIFIFFFNAVVSHK